MNPVFECFHLWKCTILGAVCDESRGGYRKGETSESLDPMNGFGMKQGRKEKGGTKRQEVEKA